MITFIIFALLALIFFLAERASAAYRQPILRRGLLTDLAYAPLYFLTRLVMNGMIALGLVEWARLALIGASEGLLEGRPLWLQSLLLLAVIDLMFYFMHRVKHAWPRWWRLHETHHSSGTLDFLSAARFHPLEKILDRLIYMVPLVILGASQEALIVWAATDAFFGMFSHSNLNLRIGPLKYLFMGPEMHRWHHAQEIKKGGCNFGNNFSVFDWIFGTAYDNSEKPQAFGLADRHYPQSGLIRQFLYAFRPFSSARICGPKTGPSLPQKVSTIPAAGAPFESSAAP